MTLFYLILKYPSDGEIKKYIIFSSLVHRRENWGSMKLKGLSILPELVTGGTR